jgi:hypothetical protein
MSYKIANTSWLQLAFSGVVILAICRYHSSLLEVILVQLVLMIVLLICVAIPFLFDFLGNPRASGQVRHWQPPRVIRRVSEDEVIAEFLRSDFASPVFQSYQETLHEIVSTPDLNNADENAKRRALLFMRHLALGKKFPPQRSGLKSKSTKQISNRSGLSLVRNGGGSHGAISPSQKLPKKCARGKVESARHFWLKWSRLAISFFRKNTGSAQSS